MDILSISTMNIIHTTSLLHDTPLNLYDSDFFFVNTLLLAWYVLVSMYLRNEIFERDFHPFKNDGLL